VNDDNDGDVSCCMIADICSVNVICHLGCQHNKVFPGFNAHFSTRHATSVWASLEAAWWQGQQYITDADIYYIWSCCW